MTGTVSWQMLRDQANAVVAPHEARWLVERVSGYSAAELIVHADELVSARAVAFFGALLGRRISGEPIQYVLGRWPFRSIELFVDPRVLIPRPETEFVAGLAIDQLRAFEPGPRIAVDLGTGSGAIALSIATEVGDAQVWGTDTSADALSVARANLSGCSSRVAPRVRLAVGDWFDALPDELHGRVAVLVSNPPYVDRSDSIEVSVVAYEPAIALFADDQGFADLAHIIAGAPAWLATGGVLVLEIGATQGDRALAAAAAAQYSNAEVHHDLAGRPRSLVARR